MLKKTLIFFILLILIGCATTSKTNEPKEEMHTIEYIGRETVSGKLMDVYFFDPTFLILHKFPNHFKLDVETKREQWFDYLHNNIVYLFAIRDNADGYSKYFIMRGNPELTETARFYQVHIMDGDDVTSIPDLFYYYDTENIKIIDNIPTRGSLFEHMYYFREGGGKESVGMGVKFLDIFMNVTEYEEVRNAILPVIQKELEEDK